LTRKRKNARKKNDEEKKSIATNFHKRKKESFMLDASLIVYPISIFLQITINVNEMNETETKSKKVVCPQ
jgi:hypothetical protein